MHNSEFSLLYLITWFKEERHTVALLYLWLWAEKAATMKWHKKQDYQPGCDGGIKSETISKQTQQWPVTSLKVQGRVKFTFSMWLWYNVKTALRCQILHVLNNHIYLPFVVNSSRTLHIAFYNASFKQRRTLASQMSLTDFAAYFY